MADSITTTSEVDAAVQVYYDRALLELEKEKLVHMVGADTKNRPFKNPNGGTTIKFRRYDKLPTAMTPITEGVTPNGKQLSKNDLLMTMQQYGDFVSITDVVDLTVEDPTLNVASQLLSDQMNRTYDQLLRDVLISTASVTTATSGSPIATQINKADIDSVVQKILRKNGMFFTPQINASTGVGTAPIRASFWAIMNTDMIPDLETVEGFRAVNEYSSGTGVMPAEWGATGNVRWLQSTEADDASGVSTGATGDDYGLLIFGQHAYASINPGGGNASNILKGFGSSGTNDPLNQRATSGWKGWEASGILSDSWIQKLNVTKK
jgi:N4-gp56 family major capsid protein